MKRRTLASAATIVACLGVTMLGLPAAVAGSAPAVKKPHPSPSPSQSPSPAPSGTFIKAYAAIVNGSPLSLTPEDVQATSDGGSIALAETETSQGLGADWLVKLSATGTPQWQEQVGCASAQGAPGDYADGVSPTAGTSRPASSPTPAKTAGRCCSSWTAPGTCSGKKTSGRPGPPHWRRSTPSGKPPTAGTSRPGTTTPRPAAPRPPRCWWPGSARKS